MDPHVPSAYFASLRRSMPAKKSDAHRRSSIVRIRLTPNELEALSAAASSRGMALSALIRHLATGSELPRPPAPKIDQDAYRELGQIGTNINQIAKRLNTPHGIWPTTAEIHAALSSLQEAIKRIRLRVLQ